MNQDRVAICREIREETVRCIGSIGVGHIGGCLSLTEILGSLYFKHMHIDPLQPQMAGRDRLIVSKGHAGPAVYATLAVRGYFPREELLTLNASGTNLPLGTAKQVLHCQPKACSFAKIVSIDDSNVCC